MTSVVDIISLVKSLSKSIRDLKEIDSAKESSFMAQFEECLTSIGLSSEDFIAPRSSQTHGMQKSKNLFNKSSYNQALSEELENFLNKLLLASNKSPDDILPWSMAVHEVYLIFNIERGKGVRHPYC